jgi:hypothetical protein
MTRRGKNDGKRRKAKKRILVGDNLRKPRTPLHQQLGIEGGVVRVAAHRGRVTAPHQHPTRTGAGQTRTHPIGTKPARRAASKAAARSRRVNRR